MRLNINLASRRYEDVRRFFVRWGITLTGLSILLVLLATMAAVGYTRSQKSGQHINDLQQKITSLQNERDQLMAYENRPENRDVTDQKRFWNSQILRRKFSWTQLLNDLQKIMPGRANLVSVQPELTPDNRVKLKLAIDGDSHKNARELVEKMEASARFRDTNIVTETSPRDSKTGPQRVRFEISTEYLPVTGAPASPKPAQPKTKEGL